MSHHYSLAAFLSLFFALLPLWGPGLAAQNEPVELCLDYDPGAFTDLYAYLPGSPFSVDASFENGPCLRLAEDRFLQVIEGQESCCGFTADFQLFGLTVLADGTEADFSVRFEVELKCPKPACGLVDLEDLPRPTGDSSRNCIPACADSEATYTYSADPTVSYSYLTDGTVVASGPGSVTVLWPEGTEGFLTIIADDGSGILREREFCIELNPDPDPQFDVAPVVCLDVPVQFTNTNVEPGVTYDWNFGDGSTATNEVSTSHVYSAPGTYVVTLFATSDGGPELCCCTDSLRQEVVVGDLPGPSVFWVSTLCEGDTSRYWTDADCFSNVWEVSPNGDIIEDDGDSITVVWGSGPAGTISLAVLDCTTDYCELPTTVLVPIISQSGMITGPERVCPGDVADYALPKWQGVTYDWQVDGGTIDGPIDGHDVSITWPTVPGTYTISVTYGSDFLNGLPGHEDSPCTGSATFTVEVLGDFAIGGATDLCVGGTASFGAFGGAGGSFTWTIDPVLPFTTTGANTIDVDLTTPGSYVMTATVTDPTLYCTTVQTFRFTVFEALPATISGPTDYCVGDEILYTIAAPVPGQIYNWTAVGGTVTGSPATAVTVLWTAASGASVSVSTSLADAPFCTAAGTTLDVNSRRFTGSPEIDGDDGCTNAEKIYTVTVPQDPATTYDWSIDLPTAGSIASGQGTPTVVVLWNDDDGPATVNLTMTLCGIDTTMSLDVELSDPVPVVITQGDPLCPGGSTVLSVGPAYTGVLWNTGEMTNDITVTEPDIYSVQATDGNGCPSSDIYEVVEVPGPELTIAVDGPRSFRVCDVNQLPLSTLLTATTTADTVEWFCNGISQGASTTDFTFTHDFSTVPGTFSYYAVATDVNGCETESDPVIIRHLTCCGEGFIFDWPQQHFITATNQDPPDCNRVSVVADYPPDSVSSHFFVYDVPPVILLESFGDSIILTARDTGCYRVTSRVVVESRPDANGDTEFCVQDRTTEFCRPLLAEFDFTENCGEVTFINTSRGRTVSPITGVQWDFDDGNTSTDFNPVHQYGANGDYDVTLVITNAAGCTDTATLPVEVRYLPDTDFTTAPSTVCVGLPITFLETGSNLLEINWDFGDGSFFSGSNPVRTYVTAGTFTVTLTTLNAGGCRDTSIRTVTALANPAEAEIVSSLGGILCAGETTTLSTSVPADGYAWSTGESSPTIDVSTAGSFDVTVTNAAGCSRVLDSIRIQLRELPDATVVGNPFICDAGSTTLRAATSGLTYSWFNGSGTPVGSGQTLFVFSGTLDNPYRLVVSDGQCENESVPVTVQVAVSPLPTVAIVGGMDCAGDGSTITVTNFDPALNYVWSNGATGVSTFTYLAGTYTVVATDPVSGCSGSASAVIHPLPDICNVPTGCYEPCGPDTLYAPVGDDLTYAWSFNGAPNGNTTAVQITSVSGSYSVAVTNEFGCTAESDSLYLEFIDCDSTTTPCDDIVTTLTPSSDEDCCFRLTYTGLPGGIFAIDVSSPDATLGEDAGAINPIFTEVFDGGPGQVTLATGGDPLPPSASVLELCPGDFDEAPQTIIVSYLDQGGKVVCSDTLTTDCEVERECAYIARDTLVCDEDGQLVFFYTICNGSASEFSVGYFELLPLTPAAVTDPPISMILGTPLAPGECRSFSQVLDDVPAGEEFCYSLIVHSAPPEEDPTALCCSSTEEYCLVVPDCDPCNDLGVRRVRPTDEGDCCYEVILFNGNDPGTFDEIAYCLLEADGQLSVRTTFGGDWLANISTDDRSAVLSPVAGDVPTGVFALPTFCLEETTGLEQQVEIKWLSDGEIVCRDTITVECESDCGYLTAGQIDCGREGYVWNGTVVNTSDFPIGHVNLVFDAPYGVYDQRVDLAADLAPGDAAPLQIVIGPPAMPGDTICFVVALHQADDDDHHLNCCNFEACLVMPDCEIEPCTCQGAEELAAAGFVATPTASGSLSYSLSALGRVTGCDRLVWEVRRSGSPWMTVGSGSPLSYTFPGFGTYFVRLSVYRMVDGRECPRFRFTRPLGIQGDTPIGNTEDYLSIRLFPQPTGDALYVRLDHSTRKQTTELQLLDLHGRQVRSRPVNEPLTDEPLRIAVRGLPAGVYLLRGVMDEGDWVRRVVVR